MACLILRSSAVLETVRIPWVLAEQKRQLPVLFNTVPQVPVADTPTEDLIAGNLRSLWASFANNPTAASLEFAVSGPGGRSWPRYTSGGLTLAQIGFHNMTGANLAVGNKYDQGCLSQG